MTDRVRRRWMQMREESRRARRVVSGRGDEMNDSRRRTDGSSSSFPFPRVDPSIFSVNRHPSTRPRPFPPLCLLFCLRFLRHLCFFSRCTGMADGDPRVRPAGRGRHAAGQQGETSLPTRWETSRQMDSWREGRRAGGVEGGWGALACAGEDSRWA